MKTIELTCDNCGISFQRINAVHRQSLIRKNEHRFCSSECLKDFRNNTVKLECVQCHQHFLRKRCVITANRRKNKSNRCFCSKSCAATYNNLHKTTGTRRSKLEIWLESQLQTLYPNLEILFNNKEIINSELDIYFPSLKLAFELNGIYHYEPIHGPEKLAGIQNNDHRKFQACLEQNIELCIIDTSHLTIFKPERGQCYLDIIINIVNSKLAQ